MAKSVALGDLALKLQDGPFGSNLKSDHYVDAGVRVVRLQNIGAGTFLDRDKAFVSPSHFEELRKHECRPGDVLVATLGDPILRAAIQPDSVPVALNKADCIQLRCDPARASASYVTHYLNSGRALAAAAAMAHGQTRQRVNLSQLRELPVPLPPIEEQRRIAAVLDAADTLRAKRRLALGKLDSLTQSIFIDMFGDPVSNPHGWPVVRVGDVLAGATYGTSKKAGSVGRFPILRMGNLTSTGEIDMTDMKYVDLEGSELDKHLVQRDDVLFNRTNSAELVGKTAVYRGEHPVAYAGYLIRLRPTDLVDAEYLGAFMNLPSTKVLLRSMCKSIVGMANINAKEVQTISMPLPPIDEQRRFASVRAVIDDRRLEANRHMAMLDRAFAALQQRAFRGEL